jgi:hypothetical protein
LLLSTKIFLPFFFPSWEIWIFRLPNFAEIFNLKNINMEVITIESQVFKELSAKINTIAKFVAAIQAKDAEEPTEDWVDNYEVCTFLKVSPKTLQRLRAANLVTYTRIRGKNFYKISEIKRLMDEKVIRRTDEHLQDLIKNHKLYHEQRRNSKANG